jgi:hypothetical protein
MKKLNLLFVFLFMSFIFSLFGLQSVFADCDSTGLTTFTQGAWGSKGNSTPGGIRDAHFSQVFPSGMTIGGNFTAQFTSSAAIQNYLSSGGTPATFTQNYINPTSTNAGVFGGQLAALYLNVKYNDAGYLGTNSLLGQLVIISGPLLGITVNKLIDYANIAIGGGSTPYSISDLNTAVSNVNLNFDNGTKNLGFLTCQGNQPVELSSFSSNVNGKNVNLIWETKTEKNSDKFEIERADLNGNDNLFWTNIGSVKAAVLSNSPKQYSFTDKNLQSGKYQYRLKMIDNDGTFEYSKIIETEVAVPKNFELSQNYPNPFNPSTKINYTLPFDAKVILEVYNITGERISQLVNEEQSEGYYSVDFNSSSINRSISSGVYFYRITAADKSTGNNFSANKKMILLK